MLERLIGGERRAVTLASLFASGSYLPATTLAGVNVSKDSALKIASVYSAVRLIADTVSSLPVDTFFRADGERFPYRPRPRWVDQPEPDQNVSRSDHFQMVLVSLLIDGNAFVRVIRDGNGDVIALTVLNPTRVEVHRDPLGRIEFKIDHGRFTVPADDMLHITELRKPGDLRGVSRIEEARESLGLAQALTDFAATFFGNGTHLSGVIEVPGEVTKEQAQTLQSSWEAGHRGVRKSHRPGVLSGGAKWVKTSVAPDEAQMIEAQELATETVCRLFRIPVHMLQMTKPGAMSYASVEENARQFVTFTLLPYIAKLEEAYTRLLPSPAFLKFNVDGLMRGDTQSRFAAYSQALQAGWMSVNDVRRLEDMRSLAYEGATEPRVPLANVNLAAASISELDKRTSMAYRLVIAGYEPAGVLAALGLPPIEHTGLPSSQLQPVAQVDPADPADAYPVREEPTPDPVDPAEIAEAIASAIREVPAPVVNVNLPEPQQARSKRIERDEDGNITAIVEEQ